MEVHAPVDTATRPRNHVSIDLLPASAHAVENTEAGRPKGLHRNADSSTSLPDLEDGEQAIALVWKNLAVRSLKNGKVLLDHVSGRITRGLYAVMGPSGSGKTTLLNTLACRLDRNTKVSGELRLNGRGYSAAELKKCAGYVMQDDLLNANLTVEETLMYTAELRLPPSLTHEMRLQRVLDVLEQMGLVHARYTLVGSPMKKGISGGERKRLCVAQELLTKPLLLFLDEPTSGLDSVTALSLITRMRRLADARECTVVTTIHQPQAKIFNLFNYLLLLQKGRIVYQGDSQKALAFFSDTGFPCPAYENPADHFLDVITPNMSDSKEHLALREKQLTDNYLNIAPDVDVNEGANHPLLLPREATPWSTQFATLFRRTMKEQWRKKGMLMTQMVQSVVIAILIGTVFLKIGDTQTSTVRRQPVLFFCCINQGMFGAMTIINSFPSERMLSLRERAAGTYYVSAYFLAKSTAETIFQLLIPVVFSVAAYFLIGLQQTAVKFFTFTCFMILCSLASTSLALAVSAWARTTDMAVTILPMALEVCRLFGGFFLSPANLPSYFSWLDALSFYKYTYVAISLNELDGLQLRCGPNDRLNAAGQCPITSGQQTIDTLQLDKLSIPVCAGILTSYIIIARVLAFIGIRYIKW
ncbi:P-loop containing nucleoside triphosphate hydrolase protein [Haematococcus lacustris]